MNDDIDWMTMDLGALDPAKVMAEMGLAYSPREPFSGLVQVKRASIDWLLREMDGEYQKCEFHMQARYITRHDDIEYAYSLESIDPQWAIRIKLSRDEKGVIMLFLAGDTPIIMQLPDCVTERLLDDAESYFHNER